MSLEKLPQATWDNLCKHLYTITLHKLIVMDLCFKLGLYYQGLMHDISKYSPEELLTGARYYQGMRSPNSAERELRGFTPAWLHHKGRNKHHLEYWIDPNLEGIGKNFLRAPMPMRYILEMLCDRIAACKVYLGENFTCKSPLEYYMAHRHKIIIHPDTQAILEGLLEYLALHGEEETFNMIRNNIVIPKWTYGEAERW